MPTLEDVQAKARALASSGFTSVHSPDIRPNVRSELDKQVGQN
jgi:hypothetical protein